MGFVAFYILVKNRDIPDARGFWKEATICVAVALPLGVAGVGLDAFNLDGLGTSLEADFSWVRTKDDLKRK